MTQEELELDLNIQEIKDHVKEQEDIELEKE